MQYTNVLFKTLDFNEPQHPPATPSEPKPHLHLPVVPVISESTLSNLSMDDSAIGSGRFGYCTKMRYVRSVCVKRMEKALVTLEALNSEAAILYSLNSAGSI